MADALAHLGLRHIDRRQVSTSSKYATTLMEPLARMLWHSGDAPDLSDNFWAHLQASWFTAHGEQVITPALTAGPVLVDGWYFKLASRLTGQGWSTNEITHLFSRVRRPDHTVLLDVDPVLLWERKAHQLRPAELGMHGTYPTLGRDSFLDYQQRGLQCLRDMAAADGWHVLTVPALRGPAHDHRPGRRPARRPPHQLALHVRRTTVNQPAPYTWPHIDPQLRQAVDRQLDRSLSDRDATGVIGEFETEFARFVGSRHAIAYSSGTSALHAMCVAAGLGEGTRSSPPPTPSSPPPPPSPTRA